MNLSWVCAWNVGPMCASAMDVLMALTAAGGHPDDGVIATMMLKIGNLTQRDSVMRQMLHLKKDISRLFPPREPSWPRYYICHFCSVCRPTSSGVFTIGPLGPCPPPLNCEPRMAKKCNQNAHVQAKISKIFWAGGTAPTQTVPPLGREIPLTRPLTLDAAALDPLRIFPQFLSLR